MLCDAWSAFPTFGISVLNLFRISDFGFRIFFRFPLLVSSLSCLHLSIAFWPYVAAVMVATAIAAIFLLAPTEETMGTAQRIVYIHVSVAWMGLASFVLMAVTGGMYLFRRDLAWDHWSRAALEIGWLCCSLTLATGSLVGPCRLEHLVDLGPAADDRLCPVGHVLRGPGAAQRRG